MAGLLDFLGVSTGDAQKDAAIGQGILQAGLSLLQSRGRLGPALGQAGMVGLQGFQQHQQNAFQQQMQATQLEEMKRRQAMQALPGQFARTPAQTALSAGGGPTVANARAIESAQPSFDSAGYAAALSRYDPMAAQQYKASMQKEQPKIKEYREIRNPDGSVSVVGFDEYGRPVQTGQQPFKAAERVDLGGRIGLLDPITGQLLGQGFGKTATPDAVLSSATTRRGQDLTDARARDTNEINRQGQRTQIVNDPNLGIVLVDKGAGTARTAVDASGKPIPSENEAKRTFGAKNAIAVLDEADKLINGATGSYIGTGVDVGLQGFGIATGGAQNIARLKVLQANLMQSQPRMEGPQSDRDVQLYREAAGQIGDPTVPRQIKRAALEQIRQIHERYAGKQRQSSGGWSYVGPVGR